VGFLFIHGTRIWRRRRRQIKWWRVVPLLLLFRPRRHRARILWRLQP
jgi:hypothetical protein